MSNLVLRLSLLWLFPVISLAQKTSSNLQAAGIGGVAANLMEPVSLFGDFIDSACIIIGVSFIFTAVLKYVEHRRSPLMVPISTVVFLLIAGIVLVVLPFAYKVTEGGIPYRLIG